MNSQRTIRNLLLTWLLSSLLVPIYDVFIVWRGGTPNWLDVLLLSVWVVGAGTRLAPLAAHLERRTVLRWGAALLLGFVLLWLSPWALQWWAQGGVWSPPWLIHLQNAAFALALGLGLTILAAAWAVVWRLLLRLPPVAPTVQGMQRLTRWLRRSWRGPRRTRAWRPVMRATCWSLVAFLALDGLGVLLTARPVTVDWEPIITSGFPPGPSRSVRTLLVGPGGELYAGMRGGGVFRSDDGGEHWRPVNQGLTSPDVRALLVGPEGELYAGT